MGVKNNFVTNLVTGLKIHAFLLRQIMTIITTSTNANITHCYIARGVELLSDQHLDEGEDVEVRLFTREEVRDMLLRNEIWQSLMAAPLWKLFAQGA